MNEQLILSIVMEMDTKDITGGYYDYQASIHKWIQQLSDLKPLKSEIIISSSTDYSILTRLSTEGVNIRNIVSPESRYYDLKNIGANVAQGEIVLFTDSDCRPSEGFISALLNPFHDIAIECVAGKTSYDQNDLITRMHTASSFGYLHQDGPFLKDSWVLAHNVAVRRSSYLKNPFGPIYGRVGGDKYITEYYLKKGPIPVLSGMSLYHENLTYNIKGLIERHLRELFHIQRGLVKDNVWPSKLSSLLPALSSCYTLFNSQLKKIYKYGQFLNIKYIHYFIIIPLLICIGVINIVAVLILFLIPGLRAKWIEYQFGKNFPYTFV